MNFNTIIVHSVVGSSLHFNKIVCHGKTMIGVVGFATEMKHYDRLVCVYTVVP